MKHLFSAVVLAMILLAGTQKSVAAEASTEISPGGVEYVHLYMPDTEDVAIQIAWPTAWAMRDSVNQAVPYIGADLIMAGGATGFAPGEAAEIFLDLGAVGSLWVTSDALFGEILVPKENLDKAAEVAGVHLAQPTMNADWFGRIRDGFAASMAETLAQPATQGFDSLRWAVLGDTPLRLALSGDVSDIEAARHDEVLRWHAETVTRTGAHVVVAGDINASDAGIAVDALMAGLPEPVASTTPKPVADFSPRRILLHLPDAPTSTLVFLGPLPPTREGGEIEDILLASILGGNDNSVLFDATRTTLRATYTFGAHIDAYARDLRVILLSGEVATEQLAAAENVVREAYAAFRDNVPVGDIEGLIAPFAAQVEVAASNPQSTAHAALMALLDGQDPGIAFRFREELDLVTDASLWLRASSSFPAPDRMIVVAVSPDATALPDACVITTPSEAVRCR